MPDEMYKVFHWYKNDEWERFLGATTQWDLDTYLDCLTVGQEIQKGYKYMCGIAGLIHRGKSSNVGSELQGMLQALKHRGEDSTGYALYGDTDGKNFIMRFKVGENVGEGSSSVMEDVSVYDERKKIVDSYLKLKWEQSY